MSYLRWDNGSPWYIYWHDVPKTIATKDREALAIWHTSLRSDEERTSCIFRYRDLKGIQTVDELKEFMREHLPEAIFNDINHSEWQLAFQAVQLWLKDVDSKYGKDLVEDFASLKPKFEKLLNFLEPFMPLFAFFVNLGIWNDIRELVEVGERYGYGFEQWVRYLIKNYDYYITEEHLEYLETVLDSRLDQDKMEELKRMFLRQGEEGKPEE